MKLWQCVLAALILIGVGPQSARAEMFAPRLSLTLEANYKSYSLDARITVPNGCYLSGGAHLGAPEGEATIPEVEPVVLLVTRRDGICTQVVQTLEYYIPSIPVSEGKHSLVAFVVVNGEILGAASATVPNPADAQIQLLSKHAEGSKSGAAIQSVSGWINAMPPGPQRLIAVVSMWAPCANYVYELTEKGPFGITGKTLLLNMSAGRPDICLEATRVTDVRFHRDIEQGQFDSVAVQFEGRIDLDPLEVIH